MKALMHVASRCCILTFNLKPCHFSIFSRKYTFWKGNKAKRITHQKCNNLKIIGLKKELSKRLTGDDIP